MLNRLVQFALTQRLFVLLAAVLLAMAVGRAGGIAEWIADLAGSEARGEGWYDTRRRYQAVVVGAMIVLGSADTPLQQAIGFFAVALGAANAAGGYVVTERMLAMFKKKED